MPSEPTVARVDTAVYTVPTDAPEADGTLHWDDTTLVLATVHCGEAGGIGYTYAPAATAQIIDDLLADVVVGAPALDVPRMNESMRRAVRNAGLPGVAAQAISAVDIALWDMKARLLGLPLVDLLGKARDEVPVYGSGGFTTYDADRQHRQLCDWVQEDGIPRVKIKIGESWGRQEARDRHRVARARASIGAATELYVDANGAYGVKQATRVADTLAEQGVTWFEEPVSSDHPATLAALRDRLPMEVTAGEYGYTLPYFAHLLAAGAVDCLQADATRCGGITVWLRAAALAQAGGIDISGHCAPHAHAHAAAAVPHLRHLEWFHDHVRIEQLLFDGVLDPAGGSITPGHDGAPGLGLTLRADRAEPYRVTGTGPGAKGRAGDRHG
ncbi:enolase C-terminal domain-like protein [Streptomyces odontomachi]|uniref:enolase C-terminal domain-like protein n=1 Tax=Streptomyces odontomachi TaxID=2944940 RepID=UPI0021093185|nr:enolase C-terminal domain-like protein [Streptomyces sp. ODS25]